MALIIVCLVLTRVEDERALREARRLRRWMVAKAIKPLPEAPSPHQLLGDVARPLVPGRRGHPGVPRAVLAGLADGACGLHRIGIRCLPHCRYTCERTAAPAA